MQLDPAIRKIIITPLDWGLGHASRCLPLIQQWIEEGREVTIGTTGTSGEWLKGRFPELNAIELPGKTIHYPASGNLSLSLLLQMPEFFKAIKEEKKILEEYIKEIKPDLIVSDNRYGCYSSTVTSVIITHQIFPFSPFFQGFLRKKIQKLLTPFQEIWVPDFDHAPGLAGELSHGKSSLNIRYIGPLSRFNNQSEQLPKEYDYCAIVSGPDPLRNEWANQLQKSFLESGKRTVIITFSDLLSIPETENNRILINPSDGEIKKILLSTKTVISRSGYSTLMDLQALQIEDVILVPTPGQTEQEYLAQLHGKKYQIQSQKEMSKFKF